MSPDKQCGTSKQDDDQRRLQEHATALNVAALSREAG